MHKRTFSIMAAAIVILAVATLAIPTYQVTTTPLPNYGGSDLGILNIVSGTPLGATPVRPYATEVVGVTTNDAPVVATFTLNQVQGTHSINNYRLQETIDPQL